MPTNIEVVATNCELAQEILDAGIEEFAANLANESEFAYTCIENIEPSLSAWQIFMAIYVMLLIPTFISWIVLRRKGAPADQLLILGAMSMIFPFIAPIVALMNFGQNAEAVEVATAMEAGPGLLFARKRNADDQN